MLGVENVVLIEMKTGLQDMTGQNPSLPEQPGDRKERLAKFVMELWEQHRHVLETRRRIDQKFAEENDWFVRKDTELVD